MGAPAASRCRSDRSCLTGWVLVRGSDKLAKTPPDGFGYSDQFLRIADSEMRPAVSAPQIEPRLKMFFFQTEWNVFGRHRAAVQGRSSGRPGPEIADYFQVRRPIFDVLVEDWSNQMMLPHVGVKVTEQFHQRWASANSFEK